ncbi:MAG TPA: phosphopantetheine-binding protein, partial [Thermoanaerobaculia bacterium]|nr:phosphopantetheine-binding protein [Thermoanaerobaculia bacterium]
MTVPIGHPIANIQLHVLDPELNPVPIGVAGELHLAGVGLARGYLGRPDLTAERFVPDPFGSHPGGRLYRTGDLVRWLPSGHLEFLGRIDHQVKVRGFRIELGEVETALEAAPEVREVAVLARTYGAGDRRLVAWVVPRDGAAGGEAAAEPLGEALRRRLRARLPEYMVPAAFVELPRLPRTANGKVDLAALPDPEAVRPELAAAFAEPAGELERTVAAVWREALGVDRVGRDDNFFDLGGHSLLLVQVATELRRRLERELPLTLFFQHPTVASLAAHLGGADEPSLAAESERVASQAAAGRERMRQRAARRRAAADLEPEGASR